MAEREVSRDRPVAAPDRRSGQDALLREAYEALRVELAGARERERERLAELAVLAALLCRRDDEIAQLERQGRWLRRAVKVLRAMKARRWWTGKGDARDTEARWLASAGVFDVGAYLAAYPDIARAGLDPLDHFLRFGLAENRLPVADDGKDGAA